MTQKNKFLFLIASGIVLSFMFFGTAKANNSSVTFVGEPMEQSNPIEEASLAGLAEPEDVWERIRRGFSMNPLNSKRVNYWVKQYSRDPKYIARMSERAGRYMYHIVEEVESRGMPTELALLPFVESAFQPEALSHAKAAGLWQFMPATGKVYDLEQNLWRDDRRDVLESTRAALDYFENLYKMFGDWHLALAAYNWGEGSVQRAIRRAKARRHRTDYLHLRMPRETANYVPKLEAIKRIVSNPKKYGITLPDVGNEPYFVRLTKPNDIDLETAAKLAGMPAKEFRQLNPSFKMPVIVGVHKNSILLPADKVDRFVDNLASWMDSGQPLSQWTIYRLKSGETLADVAKQSGMPEGEIREVNRIPRDRRVLANSTLLIRTFAEEQIDITEEDANGHLRLSPGREMRQVSYRVRRGDTLSGIAQRWRVSQRHIIKANRLKNSRLRIGQRLRFMAPYFYRASIASSVPVSQGQHAIHRVVQGDTLSGIAQRYGVNVVQLRITNRLSKRATIQIGQRLRIPGVSEQLAPNVNYYRVRSGDTLSSIAKRYRVSVLQIKRANRLRTTRLSINQRLEIPKAVAPIKRDRAPGIKIHRVRSGESFYVIAKKYNTTIKRLKNLNGIRSNRLRVGQQLMIPH